MHVDIRVKQRMFDVLSALQFADSIPITVTRIQLQKFVYLTDAVASIFQTLSSGGHKTYKHGPYDAAIQNAVDSLAFRGFVSVVYGRFDGTAKAGYKINDIGADLLRTLIEEPAFRARFDAAKAVAEQVGRLGWTRIVELVYAEPTFVSEKEKGFGTTLRSDDGLGSTAAFVMALIEENLALYGLEPRRDYVVDRFFEFLKACIERPQTSR